VRVRSGLLHQIPVSLRSSFSERLAKVNHGYGDAPDEFSQPSDDNESIAETKVGNQGHDGISERKACSC
jgi:hypothetical protein